ncbi:unnamed protein product [Nippostrongylus brasiliensis]|uniref:tRNA_Me_trans_C domain-containing protein n=1 Tax=Nippostrongylus brasiliensis TaxID=27835 RepID=A0A0N4YPU6_NIPBR|nr:unnamed protein product [Nippostrongylus brasiliensis]
MSRLRVAVAMSGGVDSAVSALLLKRRGYDVFGVYMINWDHAEEGTSTCPRTKDEADARSACEKLRIPFVSVNFVKEYWNDVFVNMLENYRHGRTVVPDIACNRHIKFERFRNYAVEKHGAQFIATGHYVSTSLGDFQENRLRPDRDHVTVECRIQRTHPPIACSLKRSGESLLLVKPVLPLRAVANGQMCVFYDGRECLGGGEVQKIISTLDY